MKKIHIVFIIAAMLSFIAAAVWPFITTQPFPIPGLRPLIDENSDQSRALQAAVVCLCGLWLLYKPALKSQQSLLAFLVFSIAVGLVAFGWVSIALGAVFAGYFLVSMQLYFRRKFQVSEAAQ